MFDKNGWNNRCVLLWWRMRCKYGLCECIIPFKFTDNFEYALGFAFYESYEKFINCICVCCFVFLCVYNQINKILAFAWSTNHLFNGKFVEVAAQQRKLIRVRNEDFNQISFFSLWFHCFDEMFDVHDQCLIFKFPTAYLSSYRNKAKTKTTTATKSE